MKKILIIICVVMALLVGVVSIVVVLRTKQPQNQNQQQSGFPTSPQASGTPVIKIQSNNGGTIFTKDFLNDPETKEDSANKGYYHLGNQPNVASPYLIGYIAATNYFNISLEQEPIGQARLDAETYLLQHLGVTQEQLCSLDYMVSTPDSVNSVYSDVNLEFSFCPGATKLP